MLEQIFIEMDTD